MLSTSTLAEMAEVAVAVSVVVSEGTTLICNGRVVRVASESTLGDILVATGLGGRRGHVLDVRSAVSATANRQDAELSDEIGLHAEFGRRFLFFRLRPMSDVSSEPEVASSPGLLRLSGVVCHVHPVDPRGIARVCVAH